MPVALDRMGDALYALDSRTAAITRFELTGYGAKVNEALNEYKVGHYEVSARLWEEVLKMNGNYDLAYIGIGRAALRQGEYQKAMKYYKLKHFKEGYGKAFQLYRKQWMEQNLWKILLALGILILLPLGIKQFVKLVKEIREA
jgi:tetratricopeptide (TPR) repeat protein